MSEDWKNQEVFRLRGSGIRSVYITWGLLIAILASEAWIINDRSDTLHRIQNLESSTTILTAPVHSYQNTLDRVDSLERNYDNLRSEVSALRSEGDDLKGSLREIKEHFKAVDEKLQFIIDHLSGSSKRLGGIP